jgi:hypothetical protein
MKFSGDDTRWSMLRRQVPCPRDAPADHRALDTQGLWPALGPLEPWACFVHAWHQTVTIRLWIERRVIEEQAGQPSGRGASAQVTRVRNRAPRVSRTRACRAVGGVFSRQQRQKRNQQDRPPYIRRSDPGFVVTSVTSAGAAGSCLTGRKPTGLSWLWTQFHSIRPSSPRLSAARRTLSTRCKGRPVASHASGRFRDDLGWPPIAQPNCTL